MLINESLPSENPFINGEELMDVFKISIDTLRREISSLKASGYIKREGSDKSGHWARSKTS